MSDRTTTSAAEERSDTLRATPLRPQDPRDMARAFPRGFLAIAAGLVGCGGVSMTHAVESDMRFEHCYRIDEDAQTPADAKRTCWTEWRTRYANGQDTRRMGYADDRLRTLGSATEVAPRPSVDPVACPPPTSPYQPPPSIVVSASVTLDASATKAAALQTCTDACIRAAHECAPACVGDFACTARCDASYRGCMSRC